MIRHFIQTLSGYIDTESAAVILVIIVIALLTYILKGWKKKFDEELGLIKTKLEAVHVALTDEGKPIPIHDLLIDETKEPLRMMIENLQKSLDGCQSAQEDCLKCQKQMYDRPYERCERFKDCPVISQQRQLLEEVVRGMKALVDSRVEFHEKALAIVGQNRDIIMEFTGKLGAAIIRREEAGLGGGRHVRERHSN